VNSEVVRSAHSEVENSVFSEGQIFKQVKKHDHHCRKAISLAKQTSLSKIISLAKRISLLTVKLLIIFAVNSEVVRPAHSEVENSVFSAGQIF